MSFAVETVPPVTITPDTPKPPAGTVVEQTTGTVAITDPNSSSNPVTVRGQVIVALATERASVVLQDQASVTIGKDAAGNPLAIGGATINASGARGVKVSLEGANAAGATVPPERLPRFLSGFLLSNSNRSSLQSEVAAEGSSSIENRSYNTFTQLSNGDDDFIGTEFNDAIQLYKGKDVVVGGGGSDAILMDSSINKSKKKITLDREGSTDATDDVILAKGALKKGKAKIVISDYNFRNDTINLETKPKKVKGIGTDELKISTKNGKHIIIESDGTKFKRSGIEFI